MYTTLISVRQLMDLQAAKARVMVFDCSFNLMDPASGEKEYLQAHIPGAVFFDIDAIADHGTTLPHMLPTDAEFAAAVGALGIGSGDRVVVYDVRGVISASASRASGTAPEPGRKSSDTGVTPCMRSHMS